MYAAMPAINELITDNWHTCAAQHQGTTPPALHPRDVIVKTADICRLAVRFLQRTDGMPRLRPLLLLQARHCQPIKYCMNTVRRHLHILQKTIVKCLCGMIERLCGCQTNNLIATLVHQTDSHLSQINNQIWMHVQKIPFESNNQQLDGCTGAIQAGTTAFLSGLLPPPNKPPRHPRLCPPSPDCSLALRLAISLSLCCSSVRSFDTSSGVASAALRAPEEDGSGPFPMHCWHTHSPLAPGFPTPPCELSTRMRPCQLWLGSCSSKNMSR